MAHKQVDKTLYTAKELELNTALYNECCKDTIDFGLVESLLEQGADPLGPTSLEGWEGLEHLYENLVCGATEDEANNLPEITRIFLKYGMDIANPRVPYDDSDSINPMWSLAFVANSNGILTLKYLLDSGIDYTMVSVFLDHALSDMIDVDRADPNDPNHNEWVVWTMKMMMLAASYEHIIKNDTDLCRFIKKDKNTYDLLNFRDWDNFYYEFDTSRCEKYPEFYKSVVRIYEKTSKKKVWTMGICLEPNEYE